MRACDRRAKRRDYSAGFPARQSGRRARISASFVLEHLPWHHLPPYSPDFNTIEEAFAKLKAFLRAAGLP
jgi:transposase